MAHTSEDGKHEQGRSRNLHDPDFRAQLNVVLLRVTDGLYANPWTALNNAAKQLGFYGIQLPKVNFPDVNGGEVVWRVDPYANLIPDVPAVVGSENDTDEKIFFYFEYQLTETGRYICYAEIVNDSTLDGYLNDSTVKEDLDEARGPLEGHPYHKKSDAELHYIYKDASEAAKAMRGHSPGSESKYLDQANDAATVLHHRKTGGKRVVEDVEELDELSKNKVLQYVNKRADDFSNDRGRHPRFKDKTQKIGDRAARGMELADKKLRDTSKVKATGKITEDLQDHHERLVNGMANGKGFQKTFESAGHQKKWMAQQKDVVIHNMQRIHEELEEGLRLIKTHTHENGDHAKVYKDNEWGEHRVKFFKGGVHLANADYHTDDVEDAHSTAQHALKSGLHSEEFVIETTKSQLAKKAHAGKDIGKPGKNFKKVADKAAKEYGSKKAGEKVAAAAMWKNIKHEELEIGDEVDLLDEGYKIGDMVNVTNYKAKPQYKITGKTKTHYHLSRDDKPHGAFPKERIARVNKAAWAHRTGKPIPTQHKAAKYDDHGHVVRESEMSDEVQSLFELSPAKLLQYVAKSARSKKDREKGIDKAGKKAIGEEAEEQLDELSREKSLQYVAKAARSTKDRTKGIEKAGKKAIGEDDTTEPKRLLYFHELSQGKLMQYVAKAARSKKDREKGIDKAGKKAIGEEKKNIAENAYHENPNDDPAHDHATHAEFHADKAEDLKTVNRNASQAHKFAAGMHRAAHKEGQRYETQSGGSEEMYNKAHSDAHRASKMANSIG